MGLRRRSCEWDCRLRCSAKPTRASSAEGGGGAGGRLLAVGFDSCRVAGCRLVSLEFDVEVRLFGITPIFAPHRSGTKVLTICLWWFRIVVLSLPRHSNETLFENYVRGWSAPQSSGRLSGKGLTTLFTGRALSWILRIARRSTASLNRENQYVFVAAAKVGGIHANNTYPADFLYEPHDPEERDPCGVSK
jgi:hypothetical protein